MLLFFGVHRILVYSFQMLKTCSPEIRCLLIPGIGPVDDEDMWDDIPTDSESDSDSEEEASSDETETDDDDADDVAEESRPTKRHRRSFPYSGDRRRKRRKL